MYGNASVPRHTIDACCNYVISSLMMIEQTSIIFEANDVSPLSLHGRSPVNASPEEAWRIQCLMRIKSGLTINSNIVIQNEFRLSQGPLTALAMPSCTTSNQHLQTRSKVPRCTMLSTFVGIGVAKGSGWEVEARTILVIHESDPIDTCSRSCSAVLKQECIVDLEPIDTKLGTSIQSKTPVLVLESYMQIVNTTLFSLDILEKCKWKSYGMKCNGVIREASGSSFVLLQHDQEDITAYIAAVVVHLKPADSEKGYLNATVPKLDTVIKTSIDRSLETLRKRCPAALAGRRERSLARALPSVACSVDAILFRSMIASSESPSDTAIASRLPSYYGRMHQNEDQSDAETPAMRLCSALEALVLSAMGVESSCMKG